MYAPVLALDIPPLPANFTQKILAHLDSVPADLGINRYNNNPEEEYNEYKTFMEQYGKPFCTVKHWEFPSAYVLVLKKHLSKYIPEVEQALCGMVTMSADSYFYPHRDFERHVSLWYVMTGAEAVTSFYDCVDDDQEVKLRPKGGTYSPEHLTRTESYRLPQESWHLFSGKRVHDVDNLVKPRKVIKVDFTPVFGSYENFLEKYSHLVKADQSASLAT